jgi:hypothetical protein
MDAKGIINYGLSKVSSSRVNSIAPPTSKLEKNCAEFYPQWRDSELTKRRWVFARRVAALNLNPSVTPLEGRTFAFDMEPDMLRPIRDRQSTWIQNGRTILGYAEALTVEYIARVPESEFDPLFVDVLGWRVVIESVEFITQSNTKSADAQAQYDKAVKIAGINNALIVGPENSVSADELDEWELARMGA